MSEDIEYGDIKYENYYENEYEKTGLIRIYNQQKINSSIFQKNNTNQIFMMFNVLNEIDQEKIVKYNKLAKVFIKSASSEQGPCFSKHVSEDLKDCQYWYPSLGNGGWIRLERMDKSIDGLSEYVIMVFVSLEQLSYEFYDYICQIEKNNVSVEDFILKDKIYQKTIELIWRNTTRIVQEFCAFTEIKIKTTEDRHVFMEDEHSSYPLIGIPVHWKWVNKLERMKQFNNIFCVFNKDVCYNNYYILENSDYFLQDFKTKKETELQLTHITGNEYVDFFPFYSGPCNKIILIKTKNDNNFGFPFTGRIKSNSKNNQYCLLKYKNIDSIYIVDDGSLLENTGDYYSPCKIKRKGIEEYTSHPLMIRM